MTRHSGWIVPVALAATCALVPAAAYAQRAVPRPARTVYAPARHYQYYRPYTYYRPYYSPRFFYSGYAGWYGGFGWYPYSSWGYPYLHPYRYAYAYPYYAPYVSSARLEVRPNHAEVFVDGYFAGTVDDFDGWSQRLDVPPGQHQLEIFLAGHRSYREQVLFRPGATIKIRHVMQPLAPGDPEEARPVPAPRRSGTPGQQARPGDPVPAPRRGPAEPYREAAPSEYGALDVRVQPRDAVVTVDGERWESPDAGNIILQLADGTHRVEIRKEGFRTYSADVRVRRGETTTLNVSLTAQ